jgi:hypothetical protein
LRAGANPERNVRGGGDAHGAAAGAVAVGLFVAGVAIVPNQPGFDAPGAEVAAFYGGERTRIHVACGLLAVATPLLVWFLAAVAWRARDFGDAARRTAAVAHGCGLVFAALFLADVTSLAVGALRPASMEASPELARALRDFEFLAMGMAAPAVAAMLVAFAVLAVRRRAVWPAWVGWLAALAAVAYLPRVGTLFTTDGPFAADGVLGLWVPVVALVSWLLVGSVTLALGLRSSPNASATSS